MLSALRLQKARIGPGKGEAFELMRAISRALRAPAKVLLGLLLDASSFLLSHEIQGRVPLMVFM